ncbi:MAG: transglutaminase domain-containing protein, partial [Candidatus Cryptobacteroides sp.]
MKDRAIAILMAVILFASCDRAGTEYDRSMDFLISNMPGKSSLDTSSVRGNAIFYTTISDYLRKPGISPATGLYELADSLEAIHGKPAVAPSYSKDVDFITPDFLEAHVRKSLDCWRTSAWKDDVPFVVFLRYVLPYRVGTAWWDGAGDFFRRKYSDSLSVWSSLGFSEAAERIAGAVSSGFYSDGQFYREHPYMYTTAFENTVKAAFGECNDRNAAMVTALRAFGIPAALNVIPYWGNSNASHFWTEIIGAAQKPLYDNTQQDFHSIEDELINDSFMFKGGTIDDTTGVPREVRLRKNRTVPKVYRKNYEIDRKSIAAVAQEPVPQFFRDPCLEDITSTRLVTSKVTVRLPLRQWGHQFAYLCCYEPSSASWTPVAWAKNRLGRAVFEDVGVNVLYLPAVYSETGISAAGSPFVLERDGTVRKLKGEGAPEESLTVFSKVPLKTNYAYYAMLMRGDRILAARKRDLSDTVLLHSIDEIPYYTQEKTLDKPVKARYVIFDTGKEEPKFVAEMECWGRDASGVPCRLEGRPFGNQCFPKYPLSNAFDGDPLTYSFLNKGGTLPDWIGLDFGSEQLVEKVLFCPRNDDNAIVPGDDYELFVWRDGCWQSLGRQ